MPASSTAARPRTSECEFNGWGGAGQVTRTQFAGSKTCSGESRLRRDRPEAAVTIRGQLNLDVQAGRDAHSQLKKRVVRSLSIGFELLEHRYEKDVRIITKGEIKEVSLVVFAANPRASVTSVKEEGGICSARELTRWL